MKRIILVCLLMMFEQSFAFGASDCKIVHNVDSTEAVCIGDGAIKPVSGDFSAVVETQAISSSSSSGVQIEGSTVLYSTVQEAYDAAVDNDVIGITGATISGPLLANNQQLSVVTFKGGCDSSFTQIPGSSTTILGTVTLQYGRVIMNAMTIGPGAASTRLPINLGTAGNFVILAKSGVSTTGTTTVVGDIGVSPAAASLMTGFNLIADSTN